MTGGQYFEVGYAARNAGGAEIHIGPAAYFLDEEAVREVLVYGSVREVYQNLPQAIIGDAGIAAGREVGGFVRLSRRRQSVTVKLKTTRPGRLYIINAEALRDVMRGKIPRATVTEVIFAAPGSGKTPAAA
jgi:hypothetical protein